MNAMSIEAGELPGRMSYVSLGAGPALVVFPGLSRMSAGSSVEAQKKAAGRLQALARVTGRRVYVVQRPAGLARDVDGRTSCGACHGARALFPASVDVMGVSTGGATALQMAVDHPLVPRRLVIAGMASWLGEEGRQKLRRYGELIAQGKSSAGCWRQCSPGRCCAGR